jgi:hypothetical protein
MSCPATRSASWTGRSAYLEALTVPADKRPAAEEFRLRYAAAHAYSLVVWIVTHQSDRSQRPDICRDLIERFAAAFVDGDSAGALGQLGA